jgi:hypothetical protein
MQRKHLSILLLTFVILTVISAVSAQDACAPQSSCTEVALGLPADEIAAFPTPDAIQIAPDDNLIFDRNYRRVLQAVEIYDAPNGNVIGTMAAGFVFVTAGADENGWTQTNPNEWMKSEFLGPATVSRFSGVFLPAELRYPMGWILVNVIPSRTPGAEPLDTDLPLIRYTRVNLFANVDIDGWTWYQVGTDQWVHQTLIAKALPIEKPAEVDTQKWVSVDLYEQVLTAYEDTTPVFTTLISSGLADWATDEGLYHVYVRYPRTIMSGAEGQEDFYSLQEVPWTQYFNHDQGLHGTYWHDGFGYRHSHGCVNMSIMDSHWLFEWSASEMDFTVDNDEGAAVYVYSSGTYR